MASKKKLLTSAVALGTAAALTLGGTFAWQSISQSAINEASDQINPGGRLHDDFDGTDKNVYVENFADDDIFARIRLKEYMEVVMNYGTEAEVVETIVGTSIGHEENEDGTETIEYKGAVFNFNDRVNTDDDGVVTSVNAGMKNADSDPLWKWTVGGSTVYMPTFNVNKDSLVADVNGYYKYSSQITSQDIEGGQYNEMATYEVDDEKQAWAIYDADSNDADELCSEEQVADIVANGENAESYTAFEEDNGDAPSKHIKLVEETHTAKATGTAKLISLTDYLAMIEENGGKYDAEKHGGYWVYDDSEDEDGTPTGDGWVYWSSPIKGHTATGLLLDGIALTQVMDDTWYYSLEVEGQFVTANDIGEKGIEDEDTGDVLGGTGYYADGETVTANAEKLLKLIGVEMPTEGQETDEDEDGDDVEEDVLTLSSYSMYINTDAIYFDTLIELGDQIITQPSKLTLTVYDPDGNSKGTLAGSDDAKVYVLDGRHIRFDVSDWSSDRNDGDWGAIGFEVTYQSDEGDLTSEQVRFEIDNSHILKVETYQTSQECDLVSRGRAYVSLDRLAYDTYELTTDDWKDLTATFYKTGDMKDLVATVSGSDFYSTVRDTCCIDFPRSELSEGTSTYDMYLTYKGITVKAVTVEFTNIPVVLKQGGHTVSVNDSLIHAGGVLKVEGVENPWASLSDLSDVLNAVTVLVNDVEAEWTDREETWYFSNMRQAQDTQNGNRAAADLYTTPIGGDTEEVRILVYGLNTDSSITVKLDLDGTEYSVTYVKES